MTRLLALISTVGLAQATSACASFVVDSFMTGDFALSMDGLHASPSAVGSPLGDRRLAEISSRLAAEGGDLSSTLSEGSGGVIFLADGQRAVEDRPLYLVLRYLDGGPFSLEGYDAFEFDFAEVEGSGSLIVELGSQSIYGPETFRVPIDAAGTVQVPFEMLNFGPGGSIDWFLVTHFTFEADTERFGFVLDEIRVIPEPASGLFLLLGGALLLLHRRRASPP